MKCTVISHPQMLIERANLIFCLCSGCGSEINWRHTDASFELYASCCQNTYHAQPERTDLEVYLIATKHIPASNVVKFPKKIFPLPPGGQYA